MTKQEKTEFKVESEDLLKTIKKLIKEGNIIKNEQGKTLLEIPVTLGIIGAMFLPILAGVGAIAAMAAKFTIEVIKSE
ncbi:MAG: DUF4342 domain-containing protein [Bacteroidetes bacterium]|nr:DUF4342 domain-containing protein [Bacteroidota bacterium]MBT3423810.1 DUF4342 domain-containing protein [Bacteroidota bacterium]MBT3800438.1 DUF4342 domain-containing protein [Bacteroidota bacterium]MBT4339412.1 DUF4342 domain-containing protein [Bacteroidota bacterium]MBT4969969.1 DUF4342 domain-containing protein [Bacteroidota bacterium]